ncbi:MAG: protein translocase subunit SecD [Oligoflexia bacterium]|nr:MAG: protein translocase subunit SecD [Oligoflexia bacterium]
MEGYRLRSILAILGLLMAIVWVAPNVINVEKMWWPSKQKLNYGLDIQGGLHLVMGVDVAGVVSESTNRITGVLKAELDRENIPVTEVKASKPTEGELEIVTTEKDKAAKWIEDRYSTMLQKMSDSGDRLTYRYYDAYMNDFKNKVIQQAIETIRNRIDEFGVAEPSISQQGSDRILVQLPGMADAEKAKALINTAAKLDFMMVEDVNPAEIQKMIDDAEKAGNYSISTLKYSEYVARLNKDLTGKIPEKTMVLFEKADNAPTLEAGRIPFVVRTDTNLGGDALSDAFVSFNEYGAPEVALRFNSMGANAFKNITGANIGKRMAVVLDKVVKTAPNIQTQIGNGQAVITLGGGRDREKTLEEAKMISTALRAGALPASLEQLEERRIGPSLGADSIKKAQFASWIGAIAILIFMLLRYRTMGLVADISLAVNILSVFALLTSLGATLTLPGIAGIALTVGFAIDANVLINERMREEIRKGSGFNLAVKEGYHRAMSAIMDANITVAATAVVLLYFGTGPVRGFAVTLLIGIVTTLFANVFVSKVLVDTLVHKFGMKKLSV